MYIEDITIFPSMLEQLHEDVDCVLERLETGNLIVNVKKCAFDKEEVVVLGFKFSKKNKPKFYQGIGN